MCLTCSPQKRLAFVLLATPADDNFDLLIGCTSVYYGMTMVTENIKDFKNIGKIRIENWIKR